MLNDVIKLVDPRFQSVVAHVLHIVPKEILMTIIDSAPDSKIRIIECLDSKDNNITRVRYASIIKKWVQVLIISCFDDLDDFRSV